METKKISAETLKFLLKSQKDEITEYHIYKRLALSIKDEHNASVLNKIAHEELRHSNIWKKYTGVEVKPNWWKVHKFFWIARILGLTFGVKLMEKGEKNAQLNYNTIANEVPEAIEIQNDENEHESELINIIQEEKLEYVGSIVLGLNDALVEILGTLAGMTFALQNNRLVALVGIITGIAGALSMSSSEYLSTRTEGNKNKALKSSLYTGIAYFGTVVMLVLPFLLMESPFMSLIGAVINSVIVIFLYSYYISVANDQSFKKRFLEMFLLSTFVGIISFLLGYIIRIMFGIDI